MGIFEGSVHFRFFPGSTLLEQYASMTTNEADTAYFYDAGLAYQRCKQDAEAKTKEPGGVA